MPHSVLSSPRQRPARASSPASTRLVQGTQPIDGIALGDQRMLGQAMLGGVRLQPLGRPAGQRVDLDAAAVRLEQTEFGAHGVLEALAAGEPGIETAERTIERLGLADLAAEVRVGHPQRAMRVFRQQPLRIGGDVAHIGESEVIDQP